MFSPKRDKLLSILFISIGRLRVVSKLRLQLNLPAVLPSLSIWLPAEMLFKNRSVFTNDMLMVVSLGVFVPPLWYCVGWWIDDQRGSRPRKLFTLSKLWKTILVRATMLLSLPIFILGVIMLLRTLISRQYSDALAALPGMLGWSGWLSWISLTQSKKLFAPATRKY